MSLQTSNWIGKYVTIIHLLSLFKFWLIVGKRLIVQAFALRAPIGMAYSYLDFSALRAKQPKQDCVPDEYHFWCVGLGKAVTNIIIMDPFIILFTPTSTFVSCLETIDPNRELEKQLVMSMRWDAADISREKGEIYTPCLGYWYSNDFHVCADNVEQELAKTCNGFTLES